jgi:hypothetical protein
MVDVSRCVGVDLINALFYGTNKGIGEIMGNGGMVLGRRIALEITNFLKNKGLIKDGMDEEDIRQLFVEVFGLSEDLIIEDRGKEVVFRVIKPVLTDFLEEVVKNNLTPYVCPFVGVLSNIYSEAKKVKLMLVDVKPESKEVELIFKKI